MVRLLTRLRKERPQLVLDPIVDAITMNGFVPIVTFVPPVLDNVGSSLGTERFECTDVVGIADPDQSDFPLILETHQRAPCLKSKGECAKRRVKDVAIEIRRVQVGEGGLQGLGDLLRDRGSGVVG
jgi:hypothetical protein